MPGGVVILLWTTEILLLFSSEVTAYHKVGCMAHMFRAAGVPLQDAVWYERVLTQQRVPLKEIMSSAAAVDLRRLGISDNQHAEKLLKCVSNAPRTRCSEKGICTGRGKCVLDTSSMAKAQYGCLCDSSFRGTLCQVSIKISKPCPTEYCEVDGECTQQVSTKLLCKCREGSTLKECEALPENTRHQASVPTPNLNVNPCHSSPCEHGTVCLSHNRGVSINYMCLCLPGFVSEKCPFRVVPTPRKSTNVLLKRIAKKMPKKMCRDYIDPSMSTSLTFAGSIIRRLESQWHASKNCFIDGELVSQGVTSQSHIFTDSVNGLRFRAYCDMRDRAWTVFQRRTSTNPISFYRDFRLYRDGFGSPETSFWLGLEPLHLLTALKMHELRVDMEDVYGNVYVAEYAHIYVGDAADNYRLTLGAYSGTPHGDFLRRSSGAPFSTLDSDNDMLVDANCARMQRTGWWLRNCTEVRFNGEYSRYGNATHAILGLSAGRGIPPLHMVEMKIRPATCRLSCHWLQNKFSSRAGRDGQL